MHQPHGGHSEGEPRSTGPDDENAVGARDGVGELLQASAAVAGEARNRRAELQFDESEGIRYRTRVCGHESIVELLARFRTRPVGEETYPNE
ncbi:hypothetical protein GCM10022381_26380 [Leifsonia kafniensis]|uniref:Uncharacterized protein n=1 Tax=Leifsonia kafniensis TaxID=475957 RepID=A0ABP7KQH1_9MICO